MNSRNSLLFYFTSSNKLLQTICYWILMLYSFLSLLLSQYHLSDMPLPPMTVWTNFIYYANVTAVVNIFRVLCLCWKPLQLLSLVSQMLLLILQSALWDIVLLNMDNSCFHSFPSLLKCSFVTLSLLTPSTYAILSILFFAL